MTTTTLSSTRTTPLTTAGTTTASTTTPSPYRPGGTQTTASTTTASTATTSTNPQASGTSGVGLAAPMVTTRKTGKLLSPKPKRLLSQAACLELDMKLRTLEETPVRQQHFDDWCKSKGKHHSGSVKEAIKKLSVTHKTLGDIDAGSIRRSLAAFYPKMSDEKVALVIDGLVAKTSIFNSIASVDAARSLVSTIKAHRGGKVADLHEVLARQFKLANVAFSNCREDIRIHDVFFANILFEMTKYDASEKSKTKDLERRDLQNLLEKLEPAPVAKSPRLVRRSSAGRKEKKVTGNENRRSAPTGLVPLPLTFSQGLVGSAYGSAERKSPTHTGGATGKSAQPDVTPPKDEPTAFVRQSSSQVTATDTSESVVVGDSSSTSTTSTASNTPRARITRAPITPRSSTTRTDMVASPSSPGPMPRKMLRTPTGKSGDTVETGKQREQEKQHQVGKLKAHPDVKADLKQPSRRTSIEGKGMTEADMKKELLRVMVYGGNYDNFVDYYGALAWEALTKVVGALDENAQSSDFRLAQRVVSADLEKDERKAIIAASRLPHPTHLDISEDLPTFLGLVAGTIRQHRRNLTNEKGERKGD